MSGFRYCQWCDGKGCMCCDAEQKTFTARALERAPKWRPGDVRDIRDACVEAEMMHGFRGLDRLTEDQVEAMFKPALNAEYVRQFPNGPEPMLTIRQGSGTDMELLRHVMHRNVIEKAFGPDGGGMEEIESRAAEAMVIQALIRKMSPDEDKP